MADGLKSWSTGQGASQQAWHPVVEAHYQLLNERIGCRSYCHCQTTRPSQLTSQRRWEGGGTTHATQAGCHDGNLGLPEAVSVSYV